MVMGGFDGEGVRFVGDPSELKYDRLRKDRSPTDTTLGQQH